MMRLASPSLKRGKGITSYKLLGTGSGKGFNAWPDFSTYALLIFWENEALADTFINGSKLFNKYRQHAHECYTVYHVPISSHGAWKGENPFKPDLQPQRNNDLMCAITRASLNIRTLHQFWRYVPKINNIIDDQDGLLFYKGIGEWPVMEMATYSIWKNMDSMKAFAYNTDNHKGAISNSRRKNWFKEDLFVRLQPYKTLGSWQNENPLHGYLK
jgi:heme-degrading monooxygenase HmoA